MKIEVSGESNVQPENIEKFWKSTQSLSKIDAMSLIKSSSQT